MKKRYVGVLHLTPEGDGVIQILEEDNKAPSLQVIEQQKAFATARLPY